MYVLEDGLRELKKKNTHGPEGITNELLKHLGPIGNKFLLSIFNQNWRTGIVCLEGSIFLAYPEVRKG